LQQQSQRIIGRVRNYRPAQGFGFLVTPDGTSHYFHILEYPYADDPQPGDQVEFELKPSHKKGFPPEACAIKKLNAAQATPVQAVQPVQAAPLVEAMQAAAPRSPAVDSLATPIPAEVVEAGKGGAR
jgi:cold shock CspA family protein